jgi:pyruvate/oxaloacetate carboxyltransferase
MLGRRGRVNLVDTEEMAAFFEQLDHLNLEQLRVMRAAWRSTSREAHEDAWTTVRSIGAREGLTREIDRVRNRALAWASRGSNTIPYRISDDVTWMETKIEAGEAIVDAALAVALGSRLDADCRNVLIGPWLRATEALR